ncbi:MAG: multicopper oxidase domain-containing protein [Pseudomonadota bacterium]|nr:multicopper oxidase domain-containing protein [Pseudomonadota bacterium]
MKLAVPSLLATLFGVLLFSSPALAKTVRYALTVSKQPINMSGKKNVDFALMVNGGIPAPTLEFTEGDDAEIIVTNNIPGNEEVSIHWHGILLPPEMDGVAYVNTPPIFPGKSHTFRFKIRQNGTYWYHSHTAVQEQKGVYGAFIIHPKKKAIQYDKDLVIVLSDWSDEDADQIIRNLRKDGDYYLYKKDSVRSYFGALRAGGLKTHLANEWDRMGGMDLSDVGYDAFLINGKRDSQLLTAHPGEKIRIRIINAAASSYFYVSLGQSPMQVISADGVDIKPVMAKEILMGMAETYDVLFTPSEHKNYELRATVQDVTGFASGWIGMGEKVRAPDKPLPDLYSSMDHVGHGGMSGMSGMDHGAHADHEDGKATIRKAEAASTDPHAAHRKHGGAMKASPKVHSTDEHSKHKEPSKPKQPVDFNTQSDAMLRQNESPRDLNSKPPVIETLSVDSLEAIESTALPKDAKVHDLKLVLGGDMERYIWHINGKAIYENRFIEINKGEVVRFTFQNDTMMHHPMHLHGHFFRVINQHGDLSPLKHTVDVPPHGTRAIEFYANEPGQWMLHCHNLYHMKTGMARVVRYKDFQLTPEMAKHDKQDPHLHDHIYNYSLLEASSNHAKAEFKLMRTWDELNLKLESANIEGKNFSFNRAWETEGDMTYRRWFSNFINVSVGGSLYDEEGFAMAGVGYILPMLIETNLYISHEGKFRFDVEKRFQWTKNVFTEADFTWRPGWGGERDSEFEISLMYGPSWHWAAGLMATEKTVGVGAQIQF